MFETKVIRDSTIDLFGLTGLDERHHFYYDESNNFRKFRIREGGLNAPIESNFVLGGVVHEENAIDFDYYKLKDNLILQENVAEIKLKNIARGNFIQCLESNRLTKFFEWLLESDLYIHYFALNLFYFSIVDIVDSVIANSEIAMKLDMEFVNVMKSNLYTATRNDPERFINLISEFGYPNLMKDKIVPFIEELIEFIRVHEERDDLHVGLVSLRQILKESISKGEMVFLEDNEDYILIEDFMHFYLQPIYMFINSKHDFDEESTVFSLVEKLQPGYDGELITNFSQSDSRDNKMIQISDIVTGLMAKFLDFITGSNESEIQTVFQNLSEKQQDNFDKLRQLINKSNNYNKAFLHYSLSIEDRVKLSWLGF
ncbi:DUF3800 domain-containing protein [Clostridium algidicarnis]|uniref:DUF3800 domain-containing protein n=1 Tax=Clostridium algidicarnis TaxID=37659 RepID=UPI001C0ABC88|nr:DUF3800 domain-containing protein [Clostridium algidicarnis]MBU3196517.1 DUF3800 domain-containing protein [Clostridium algidicarnis]MCB2287805.1 DUF3800 domain-containing protein [Clostridium algidicarnis]